MRTWERVRPTILLAMFACFAWSTQSSAQGLIIPTAGPINSAMAGASVAAPVDFGASYWNPATISGLDRSEALVGSALILPSIHFKSDLPAGSVGGLLPTSDRSGISRSNSGVASNLATGTAFRRTDDSPWTYGIGIFGLAGGGVNFGGSSTQPLLTPRNPPKTFGVGPIYSAISTIEITPIASYQATEKLAVAAGPIITGTSAIFDPAFFAPDSTTTSGLQTFPNASNARPFWGGGFQFGLLYNINQNWNFGFSYKSPIYQERWSYNSETPGGNARYIGLQSGFPEILSWGVAYKGIPKTLIDIDFRYFDYKDAQLFGQKVVSGGLGWNSVFAVALGGQYQLTEKLTLRGGYLYNTNPIPATNTLFNVQAPAIIEHSLSMGASYKLSADVTATAAWVHGFRNSISGGVEQLNGASTRLDAQSDSLVFGLNIQFGRTRKPSVAVEAAPVAEPVVESTVATEPPPVALATSAPAKPQTDAVAPAALATRPE